MRNVAACGALLLISACVSAPDVSRAPNAFQLKTCDEGMRLMRSGWMRTSVPAEAETILAAVRFKVPPLGFIWYSNETSAISACAYTSDKWGCGYSGHQFKREAGLWFHATTWAQDRVCVVG